MGSKDPDRKAWVSLSKGAWVDKPIARRDLLSDKGFLEAVAARAGVRPETISRVLSEAIRVTVNELRDKGIVRWPGFGDFFLVRRKERIFRTAKQGVQYIPDHFILKYKPYYKLQKYFSQFSRLITGKNVIKLDQDGEQR